MKQLIIITLCLLVSACGDRVSGEYGGPQCPYTKMDFKGGGVVEISIHDLGAEGSYKIDGDKLILEGGGKQQAIFTIDGDTLDGGRIIGKCVKQ